MLWLNILTELASKLLCKTKIRLEAYDAFKIVPLGEFMAQVETSTKIDVIDCIVFKGNATQMLGLDACTKLGLKKESITVLGKTQRQGKWVKVSNMHAVNTKMCLKDWEVFQINVLSN